MGMRLDLRSARESGGGFRSGMAERSDNPRFAALRGLEESLRSHRQAQVALTAAPAQTPAAEPDDIFADEELPRTPVRRRRIAIPAMFRGRVMRRVAITLAALVVIAAVAFGAL